jgi:hypothetical protein
VDPDGRPAADSETFALNLPVTAIEIVDLTDPPRATDRGLQGSSAKRSISRRCAP